MAAATVGEAVRQQIAELYRRRAFHPISRYLPDEHREDRLAEAIGLTLAMALRHAARGQHLNDALLVHHAKLRALEFSRHLVGSKGRGRDVLNQANYVRGRTEVLYLEHVAPDDDGDVGGEGDRALIGMALSGNVDPSEKLASGIDLERWLASLADIDRELLAKRAAGYTLKEIGTSMEMSISDVCARCHKLGVELAGAAELPVPKRKYRRRVH